MFAAFAILGATFFAIGVYDVLYSNKRLVFGALLEMYGGILFLGSFASLIGFAIVYGH